MTALTPPSPGPSESGVWQPIETARRDGTVIWAALRRDISRNGERPDLEGLDGIQIPLRHPGIFESGIDLGWNIAAPVGYGGIPDRWIAGWMPLPAAPDGAP